MKIGICSIQKVGVLTALAACFTLPSGAWADGSVLVLTRSQQDLTWSIVERDDIRGPGQATPGDVALMSLLEDNGYTGLMEIESELNPNRINPYHGDAGSQIRYLFPEDPNFNVKLVVMTGSGDAVNYPSLSDFEVGVMCGESGILGNQAVDGALHMYNNTFSTPEAATAGKYMKVLNPNHPIMQGIPLDADGRVKIVRESYPEENAHVPEDGWQNYSFFWCLAKASDAGPGVNVLGVLDSDPDWAALAIADVGAELSNAAHAGSRLVHLPWTERIPANNVGRSFNCMTELGQVIFLRAAKWAMGETLEPYQPVGNVTVTVTAPGQIQLSWQAKADRNYRILGSADITAHPGTWEVIVEDIPGVDGIQTRKLNISGAVATAFLRVETMVPTP